MIQEVAVRAGMPWPVQVGANVRMWNVPFL